MSFNRFEIYTLVRFGVGAAWQATFIQTFINISVLAVNDLVFLFEFSPD